jgi:N-acetyl-anhydromuramyl-L-alanine amidase AmpD
MTDTSDIKLDHVEDEYLPRPKGMEEDTYYAGRPWQGGFNHSWTRNSKNEFPDLIKHIQSLTFTSSFVPRFITMHNTYLPTLVGWMNTPGGQVQRQKNLEHFFKNENHWSAGPHYFVSKDMILEGTPCNRMGTHSPSWNDESIGIEMAGDYDKEAFDPSVKANVTYLLAVLQKLLKFSDPSKYILGVKGLHFHKEDPGTTHKACPGKNVKKDELIKMTIDKMWKMRDLKMPNRLGETHLSFDRLAQGPMGLESEINTMPLAAGTSYPKLAPALKGRTLRVGSYGSVVLLLQKLLKSMGYQMNSSGYYGMSTFVCVKDFQKKKNLRIDGEVGEVTASMIDVTLSPTPGPTPNPVDPVKPTPDPVTPIPVPEGGWSQDPIPFPK